MAAAATPAPRIVGTRSLASGAWLARLDSVDFGVDRREHFLDVADHGVIRLGHDRRVGIRVDGKDVLGRSATDHVLNRAADAAGDIEVGRDPCPGLADLVAVRPPAETRYSPRAADRAAEQRRQLLQRPDSLGTAHPAATPPDAARPR